MEIQKVFAFIPRKCLKLLAIPACICTVITLLVFIHSFGVILGIASREIFENDDSILAAIPKQVSSDMIPDVHAQVKKYDESVIRHLKAINKEDTKYFINMDGSRLKCTVLPYKIVFFIRLPKCASTSFVNVLKRLSNDKKLHLTFNPSGAFNWDTETTSKVAEQVERESQTTKLKYIYARHFYFVNFLDYSLNEFTYVTIVREPVSRFVSSYLYYHFSSRPHIQAILDPKHRNESLRTCLQKQHEGCQRNLLTKYFCGHSSVCKQGSSKALTLAKSNIEHYFAVVGIMEDMLLTYRLMRHFLPGHFQYLNPEADSQNVQNKNERTVDIPDELRREIEEQNKYDILLYYYIRERLYNQASACSVKA